MGVISLTDTDIKESKWSIHFNCEICFEYKFVEVSRLDESIFPVCKECKECLKEYVLSNRVNK